MSVRPLPPQGRQAAETAEAFVKAGIRAIKRLEAKPAEPCRRMARASLEALVREEGVEGAEKLASNVFRTVRGKNLQVTGSEVEDLT